MNRLQKRVDGTSVCRRRRRRRRRGRERRERREEEEGMDEETIEKMQREREGKKEITLFPKTQPKVRG